MWNESEHSFPMRPLSPLSGRPPVDNCVVLTAILLVLKTGIGWGDLPLEPGYSY